MPAIADRSMPIIGTSTNGANGHLPISVSRDSLIEALYREPGKAEIIGGRIQRFMPTGAIPSKAAGNIFLALMLWKRATGMPGSAFTDNTGFLANLSHRFSFSPDVSYYAGENFSAKFLPSPPVFAVEVRSEGDYSAAMESEMTEKRADYFAAGTEVVWDVDVLRSTEIIRKFIKASGAETPVAVFRRGDTADAEPAVPGFTMPVDDLFV